MTFLAVTTRDRARAFYGNTLGLKFVSEDTFAIVFELGGGILLRLSPMETINPARHTVLGWQVPDVAGKAAELRAAGIEFQNYGLPGQGADGIWKAPSGDQVAWFLDPDGNNLSISSLPR